MFQLHGHLQSHLWEGLVWTLKVIICGQLCNCQLIPNHCRSCGFLIHYTISVVGLLINVFVSIMGWLVMAHCLCGGKSCVIQPDYPGVGSAVRSYLVNVIQVLIPEGSELDRISGLLNLHLFLHVTLVGSFLHMSWSFGLRLCRTYQTQV